MVRRIYVEKKEALRQEAAALLSELQNFLGLANLTGLRVLNRYDVEGLDEETFQRAVRTIFSEPQTDDASEILPVENSQDFIIFAVEPLPGQFDQRADSASQCIQLMTQGSRSAVRTAKIYLLSGQLTSEDIEAVKHYVINPVEAREASLEQPETLEQIHEMPPMVETLTGFIDKKKSDLSILLDQLGLAMDLDDLQFLQDWFRDHERRDPTITEVRVIDTYWSDHCRHTTFSTHLDSVDISDPEIQKAYQNYLDTRKKVYGEQEISRPKTFMDIATIAVKYLKKQGALPELDESEEINACSIHVPVKMDGGLDGSIQDWLLMFKNETHNHPTEIEPFGGAATCIGGCIRDPLSGRAYVHQAMRITGCGDPRAPISETLSGKLPQRKLAQTAAAGYSSYGNQIGLATGLVDELYHPGYIAKHMEVGAVIGAVPAESVRRERPAPGDIIILLGGRTGRDGIGGATGSSKSHNLKSLSTMASEVQKGNAPEERKIQRLFRDGKITRLIKRCNDFGAGGVSVAIGELADGLEINLDAVRKKYEGLDGTELAISESQERMAVVVDAKDVEEFIAAAQRENLEAYPVACVTESPRLIMRWQGQIIVDLPRAFLDTNGAVKHTKIVVPETQSAEKILSADSATKHQNLREIAASLPCASRRGLAERFDATIGAGSLLMPFGGKYQRTPTQVMAALLPILPDQDTEQASVMAWGCNPDLLSANPYQGAYISVTLSLAKLTAAGADYRTAYLTLQEYFEKLGQNPERWGKPFAALLGAMQAQLDYGRAAIGGKDSMSGTFLNLDVPPTLISFAVAPISAKKILSPEFKQSGNPVYLFIKNQKADNQKSVWDAFYQLHQAGKIKSAWAVEHGIAEGIIKMSFGNSIGFASDNCSSLDPDLKFDWYRPMPGAMIAELTESIDIPEAIKIGVTSPDPVITLKQDSAPITELLALNESVLEPVYANQANTDGIAPLLEAPAGLRAAPHVKIAKPRVLIPVFPGTNCEYDSARSVLRAGLEPEILVINNQSAQNVAESAERFAKSAQNSQIIFIPGGFSGGDEPDGSGKFITAFFRSPSVKDATMELLQSRDGLILGICNGFQALIKLGLVPYGQIIDTDETCPTLSYNKIGRHQSRIVRTRIASNRSPWLLQRQVGDVISVPISHGEGRFLCPENLLEQLAENGQIATQYADLDGLPSMDIAHNPNGSDWAVEGILSPDGRVFGKMGHSERTGPLLYQNVPGNYNLELFESAKLYFN